MLHEWMEGNRRSRFLLDGYGLEEFYHVRLIDLQKPNRRKKIVLRGMHRGFLLGIVSRAMTPKRRREALKRRLSVLLATALMLSATVVASGPASALPPGNNGNHFGDYAHTDNGKHNGAGAGLGMFNNERRGLR